VAISFLFVMIEGKFMPLRTRDFLLYLLSFAFLVIAICVTIVRDTYTENSNMASVINADANYGEVIYTATFEEKPGMDRSGNLATLRSKIADFKESVINPNTLPEPVEEISVETNDIEPTDIFLTELKCPLYQNLDKDWSPKGLNFSVVEGARLLYREVEINTSSSSATSSVELTKEVLLQLPVQTYASTKKSCIPNDVVGVALDGSLIKNNEYSLYSIFDSETLVGYALDGFPIHGQLEEGTDECGGVFVDGQYSYYISSKRKAVLYCYSGIPVEI